MKGDGRNGSDNVMAKLSEEQVREIRNFYKRRAIVQLLADRYGVSRWTIQDVVRAKQWKHVSKAKP